MTETEHDILQDFQAPKDIHGAEMAFGPSDISKLLPSPMSKLPSPYNDATEIMSGRTGSDSERFVSDWFYKGLELENIETVGDIDASAAIEHIGACLSSFQPSHQHKTAGAALLADLWFDVVETEDDIYEMKGGDI